MAQEPDADAQPQPPCASDEVRRQLLNFCSSERTRHSEFTVAAPTQWQPGTVRHPETGEPFTPKGAWDLVSECLDQGYALEIVILQQPAGKKGYVMKVPGFGGETIYI